MDNDNMKFNGVDQTPGSNGGNKKQRKHSNKDNPVKDFFLNIWIWFKETAWVQVVLVVVLVFAIVISIPLIVRAATAVKPDEDVALSYWKGKRKNVNEVNSYGKNKDNEYTTIFYYSEDSGNQALSVNKAFSDYIFSGENKFLNVEKSFYAIDLTRNDENSDNDIAKNPDITKDQDQAIALILAKFYSQALKDQKEDLLNIETGSKNVSRTSGKSFEGKTSMPTDAAVIAVYKNSDNFDITKDYPVSVRYGFTATDASTVRKEFFATISANFTTTNDNVSPVVTYLNYDINNPDGEGTSEFIRYKK